MVEADPDVDHAISFIGGGGGGTRQHRHACSSRSSRSRGASRRPTRSSRGCGRSWRRCEGIQLFLQAVQDVRIGGRASRTQYQYTLQDANLDELLQWGPRMLAALRKMPELKDVNTDQQTAGLELDRRRRSRHRVAARRDHARHRQHALRRVRAAPGGDDVHAAQPVPRGARDPARARPDARRARHALRALGGGRRRCRSSALVEAARATRCRCRSTTRGSSRR